MQHIATPHTNLQQTTHISGRQPTRLPTRPPAYTPTTYHPNRYPPLNCPTHASFHPWPHTPHHPTDPHTYMPTLPNSRRLTATRLKRAPPHADGRQRRHTLQPAAWQHFCLLIQLPADVQIALYLPCPRPNTLLAPHALPPHCPNTDVMSYPAPLLLRFS